MTQLRLTENNQKIYEPDGATLAAYLMDRSPVSVIRGPIGSGTSTASIQKMWQISCEQRAAANGIKYSRWLVFRDSYPALETTTIKTWLNWFPEELYGPLLRGKPMLHHIKVLNIDMEVYFLSLDDEGAIGKVRSLEITGAWGNELEFSPKEVFDEVQSRCGRYPPITLGGATWSGMLGDLNAPSEDHWLPALMEEVPPPEDTLPEDMGAFTRPDNWCYLVQPPALIEIKGVGGAVTEYRTNPEAENLKWLPAGYYEDQVKGKTRGWIDSRLMNRIVARVDGKRVWQEFTPEVHVAQSELKVVTTQVFYMGFDFGRSPGVVFAQLINDRWFVQHELSAKDIATSSFVGVVKKFMAKYYPMMSYRAWGDPKGRDRGQNDDKTAYQIYQAAGIMIEPAPVKNNNIQTRIDTVATVLNEMRDGKPRFLLCPVGCRGLKMDMAGGYHFQKVAGTTRFHGEPEKNASSHRCDALQYMLLGAGEGRAMVGHTAGGMLGSRPQPVTTRAFHSRRRGG